MTQDASAKKLKAVAKKLEQLVSELQTLRDSAPGWDYQISQVAQGVVKARGSVIELCPRVAAHASYALEQEAAAAARAALAKPVPTKEQWLAGAREAFTGESFLHSYIGKSNRCCCGCSGTHSRELSERDNIATMLREAPVAKLEWGDNHIALRKGGKVHIAYFDH